jgi:hypothetical protein
VVAEDEEDEEDEEDVAGSADGDAFKRCGPSAALCFCFKHSTIQPCRTTAASCPASRASTSMRFQPVSEARDWGEEEEPTTTMVKGRLAERESSGRRDVPP